MYIAKLVFTCTSYRWTRAQCHSWRRQCRHGIKLLRQRSASQAHRSPELSVGPFSVTRPNPTRQLSGPTQPTQLTAKLSAVKLNFFTTAEKLNWYVIVCCVINHQKYSNFVIFDQTQPNQSKTEKYRPDPTQPNVPPRVGLGVPTQPAGRPNQWTTLHRTQNA